MNILLSIIIPTKNRYSTLIPCIDTLLEIDSNEFEVLIQDNSSDNFIIKNHIKSIKSSKLSYFYDSKEMSVSENIDLAINNSRGNYVICIGDDDTVSQQIIEVVKYMQNKSILSCSFNFARYYWPDLAKSMKNYVPLHVPENRNIKIQYVNPMDQLSNIMKTNVYSIHKMPIVYHGILARSVLNFIYDKAESYCPGPSPDIANATAASLLIDKHLIVNIPLTIAGHSYVSTGGMGARKKHVKSLNEVSWISEEAKINWDKRLPRIWTSETVWADSLLKSLDKMGEHELLKNFNYYSFYANFLLHHPRFFLLAFFTHPIACIIGILFYSPKIIWKKIRMRYKRSDNKNLSSVYLLNNSLEGAFQYINNLNSELDYKSLGE